jgi:hypothetical protein
MADNDARVHLTADKSHISAYVEYLRSTGRSHDDSLLSQEDYDRHGQQMSLLNGEMTRRKKLTEEEEMAVYEKRYQERVRRRKVKRSPRWRIVSFEFTREMDRAHVSQTHGIS